jgi:hypothetical protein
MLQIVTLVLVVLLNSATSSKADTVNCSRVSELRSAHARWAAARQTPVDPAHNDEACRAYGTQFYEAVTTRHAVSLCSGRVDSQQELGLLDTEIDAFNNLIAAQCGS